MREGEVREGVFATPTPLMNPASPQMTNVQRVAGPNSGVVT